MDLDVYAKCGTDWQGDGARGSGFFEVVGLVRGLMAGAQVKQQAETQQYANQHADQAGDDQRTAEAAAVVFIVGQAGADGGPEFVRRRQFGPGFVAGLGRRTFGKLVEQGGHPVQRGAAGGMVAVGVGPDVQEGVDEQGIRLLLPRPQAQRQRVEARCDAAVEGGEGAQVAVAALGEQVAEEVFFVLFDAALRR